VADDLTQEAFCRILERWDRVSNMDNLEGYLYRTALNLHFQARRRIVRALTHLVRPVSASDPLEAVESSATLERCFLDLTARQRAALLLTAVLGYTSGEAAIMLGVRPGTVRRLSSQGLARIRSHLEVSDE
jgi:RNA polymerase sigma-70 factor (ECF subfamily)